MCSGLRANARRTTTSTASSFRPHHWMKRLCAYYDLPGRHRQRHLCSRDNMHMCTRRVLLQYNPVELDAIMMTMMMMSSYDTLYSLMLLMLMPLMIMSLSLSLSIPELLNDIRKEWHTLRSIFYTTNLAQICHLDWTCIPPIPWMIMTLLCGSERKTNQRILRTLANFVWLFSWSRSSQLTFFPLHHITPCSFIPSDAPRSSL